MCFTKHLNLFDSTIEIESRTCLLMPVKTTVHLMFKYQNGNGNPLLENVTVKDGGLTCSVRESSKVVFATRFTALCVAVIISFCGQTFLTL